MTKYKRWQGVRAAHVPLAKRDGVTAVHMDAAGYGYIEVRDTFGGPLQVGWLPMEAISVDDPRRFEGPS